MSGKNIYGVGLNSGSRPTYKFGRTLRQYALWKNMIGRCSLHLRQDVGRSVGRFVNYKDVRISDNFLNYEYFYDWCTDQIGYDSVDCDGDFYQLDKDLLSNGNLIYHEDVCVFVPKSINFLLLKRERCRGKLPIGVCFDKSRGKYKSSFSCDGKTKFIGRYDTSHDAYNAYLDVKLKHVQEVATRWNGLVDDRVLSKLRGITKEDLS